jgi:hypothetical protein
MNKYLYYFIIFLGNRLIGIQGLSSLKIQKIKYILKNHQQNSESEDNERYIGYILKIIIVISLIYVINLIFFNNLPLLEYLNSFKNQSQGRKSDLLNSDQNLDEMGNTDSVITEELSKEQLEEDLEQLEKNKLIKEDVEQPEENKVIQVNQKEKQYKEAKLNRAELEQIAKPQQDKIKVEQDKRLKKQKEELAIEEEKKCKEIHSLITKLKSYGRYEGSSKNNNYGLKIEEDENENLKITFYKKSNEKIDFEKLTFSKNGSFQFNFHMSIESRMTIINGYYEDENNTINKYVNEDKEDKNKFFLSGGQYAGEMRKFYYNIYTYLKKKELDYIIQLLNEFSKLMEKK